MAILKFPLSAVLPLAEHAKASAQHSPTLAQLFERELWKNPAEDMSDEQIFASQGRHMDLTKIPAGLWLVKDSGIYLMSNGTPGMPAEGGRAGSRVVYAAGFNPEVDEEYYDAARAAVGGDDFAEFVPLEWIEAAQAKGVATLEISVTPDSLGMNI